MRIYLNLSAWNRPFDDWGDAKIRKEAEAVIQILAKNENVIIASDFAIMMVNGIKNGVKYEHVSSLIRQYSDEFAREKVEHLDMAIGLQKVCNLSKLEDAIHVILACIGDAECFVTTDDEILNEKRCIEKHLGKTGYKLRIANPLELV